MHLLIYYMLLDPVFLCVINVTIVWNYVWAFFMWCKIWVRRACFSYACVVTQYYKHCLNTECGKWIGINTYLEFLFTGTWITSLAYKLMLGFGVNPASPDPGIAINAYLCFSMLDMVQRKISHYQITPKNDNTTSIFCVSCKYSWLRVGIKGVIWKNSRNKEVFWRFYINIETGLGCMFHTLDLGVFKEELCTTFASYRVQHCKFSCSHDANMSLHF